MAVGLERSQKINQKLLISKNRQTLMGFATCMIIFYHAPTVHIVGLQQLQTVGYGGVELFLVLSSYGLYFAWKRDSSIKNFYYKRAARILPYYIPVLFLRAFWDIRGGGGIQELIDPQFIYHHLYFRLWFVPYVLFLYVITPLYLKLFTKNPKKVTVIMTILAFCLSFMALGKSSLFIAAARTPIFLLGFYVAYIDDKSLLAMPSLDGSRYVTMCGSKLSGNGIAWVFFCLAAAVLSYGTQILLCFSFDHQWLAEHGLMWFPLYFGTLPLVLLLSLMFDKVSRSNVLLRFLLWSGKFSFEIYLLHQITYEITAFILQGKGLRIYALSMIISFAEAIILNYAVDLVFHFENEK